MVWEDRDDVAGACCSGMAVRVFDRQPFGGGGGVEGAVGGDEHERAEAVGGPIPVDVEGGGELHGVVGAEPVRVRQPHGVVHQGGRDLRGEVATGQVLAEPREDRGGLAPPRASRPGGGRRRTSLRRR